MYTTAYTSRACGAPPHGITMGQGPCAQIPYCLAPRARIPYRVMLVRCAISDARELGFKPTLDASKSTAVQLRYSGAQYRRRGMS